MAYWQGSSSVDDGPQNYWRAFQIALFLVVFGGVATTVIGQSSTKSCEASSSNLNTLLVQYSLPILTLVVAFLVMATLKTSGDGSQLTISMSLIKTWILTASLLGVSVAFIEGISLGSRMALGLLLVLLLAITIFYFALLVQVALLRSVWLLFIGLLLPGILGAVSSCASSSSPSQELLVQIAITSGVSLLVFGVCLFKKVRITIDKTPQPRTLAIALPILAMSLFFGAITIPVRMNNVDKIDYLNAVASMRLPIFAVSTFLLVASPIFIHSGNSSSKRLVVHRRLGVIGGITALLSLILLCAYFPVMDVAAHQHQLALMIAFVSTSFSMLLPWFLLRLRENRIDRFDSLALFVSGSLILIFRQSTLIWQFSSLVAVLALVVLFLGRHIFRTHRVLTRESLVENSFQDGVDERLVTVVIPSFNPGAEVINTISRVRDEFTESSWNCEIIVVSDGSTDDSIQLLEDCKEIDRHIWLRTNHGKGAALREGFAQSDGSIICFIDADGDLDPSVLPSMVSMIESNRADIVYGNKLHPDSNIEMSFLRRAISSGFRLLVRVLFRFDVADTQTGVKAFSGKLMNRALPLTTENGFNLDLELFVVAHALGYRRFSGHPIVLDRRGTSSVGVTTIFQMLFSTLRLFRRRSLTLDYIPLERV